MAPYDNLLRIAGKDARVLQLVEWLTITLQKNLLSIQFASEDASFRRYFRVFEQDLSYIVMDAPVEYMKIEPFIRIARKFHDIGLNVPQIREYDEQLGFAIITDFGNSTYFDVLTENNSNQLYDCALNSLILLQRASDDEPDFLPPYDATLLRSEMELFRQWYLPHKVGIDTESEVSEILDSTFDLLISKALEQPKVWVHLDYHSRNLMFIDNQDPGIIDFQDAVLGPFTYDLVSLLRDCYIVWPREKVEFWITEYLRKARNASIHREVDAQQFIHWFDWMGLQRHIKVVGVFTRLNDRDSKSKFLKDIPTVLAYIESVSRKYTELKPMHELISRMMKS